MFLPTFLDFRLYSVCNWPISLNHSLCSCQGTVPRFLPSSLPLSRSLSRSFLLPFRSPSPRRQFSSPSVSPLGSPAVLNPENDTEFNQRSLDSFLLTLCVLVNPPLRCLTRSLSFCHLGMASFDELSFLLRFRSGSFPFASTLE